jgi:transcriptional regulator with XRE-family HTH domain
MHDLSTHSEHDAILDSILGRASDEQRDAMSSRDMVALALAGTPVAVAPVQAEPTVPAKPGFAVRLRYLRERAKLSQRALGNAIGSNQATISQLEKGYHNPGAGFVVKLATALSVPVEELTGDDPVCAAAISMAGNTPITRDELDFYLNALIEPLTARIAALEARLAQYDAAPVEPVAYGDYARFNVPAPAPLDSIIGRELVRYGAIDAVRLAQRSGRELHDIDQLCSDDNRLEKTDEHCYRLDDAGSVLDDVTSLREVAPDCSPEWLDTVRGYLYDKTVVQHGATVAQRKYSREAVAKRRKASQNRTDTRRQYKQHFKEGQA